MANQGLWERFCDGIGHPELLEDSRFKTNDDRVAHRAECVAALSAIFREKTVAQWVEIIEECGVPCGPINRVDDVVNNPQVNARNMIAQLEHPNVPDLRIPNSPLKLGETPAVIKRPPPLLGQHNNEILDGLGYSREAIDKLKEKGVIGKGP